MSQALSDAVDSVLNHLASESVLATPGREEGRVPVYSLLAELDTLCADWPEVLVPVRAVTAEIERLLNDAVPFDPPSIKALQSLVEWVPEAVEARSAHRPLPAWLLGEVKPVAAAEAPVQQPKSAEPEEALLVLDLDQSRDLLQEFHAEAKEHLESIEAAGLKLEQSPADREAVNSLFRSFHTIKGNSGFLGLVPMQRVAHEVESLLDLVRTDKLVINGSIVTAILRSRDALAVLNQQVGAALEHGRTPDKVVPVCELIANVQLLATGANLAAPLAPVQADAPREEPEAKASSKATGQTVRVNTEKLDSLMDVVGELVIVQSQLSETARRFGESVPSLAGHVGLLGRLTKELQYNAMSLRMIAIQPTFQKMERLVRDLARECGKKAVLFTAGGDTELDRSMVEEIADPLVHMVRNALDHGLEGPEDRIAAGKPEVGTVSLRASHQGGKVVIEMRDDGRGLNRDKILAKAKQKGLVAQDAQPAPDEILNMIFLPGFSTAEKVTAVSGRGVGMDVVRRNIERLRGEIEITSEMGKGTVFKVKLPLTMAIIDGLVVRVGLQRFVLPTTSVLRAVCLATESIVPVQGCGEALDLAGGLVPLRSLDRLQPTGSKPRTDRAGIGVIIESSGKSCAILVDEMVGKQEVVIKNLGSYLQGCTSVTGATILGDGTIALILDPGALLQAA
ncbi:MAG TPA: chemotaxis protein CheA [Opitutaceae bacterium]|nr:chemotaxis protein CheA [Opitutaceae bacterium]